MTEEAFIQAVETYGDSIYRVAFHALKNRADAEDVMQAVLLKLYERGPEFESEEHLKRWLLRLAVNESRSLLRSAWRRLRVSLEENWDAPAPEDPAKRELYEAVMALEAKYRLTIYLYYYEGLSVKEAAEALGARPSTVQTWLHRARQRLRTDLSEAENKEGYGYVRPQSVPGTVRGAHRFPG